MPEDASAGAPAGSTAHRKRMADDGEKAHSSSRRRPGDSPAADHAAILRGAIEFRDRTGLAPTKSNMAAFFESMKDSLPVPLSQDQVYNRLRHIRHKFNHSAAENGDDLVLKLAAQLWPDLVVKMGKKEGKGPKKEKKLDLVALEEDRIGEKEKKEGKSLKKEKKHNFVALEEDRNGEKEKKEGKSPKKEKKHNLVALEEDRIGEKEKKEEKSPKKEKKDNSVALEEDRNAEEMEGDEKGKEGMDTKLKKKQNLVTAEEEEKEDEEMKDKNGEELGIEPVSFPYLTHSVAEHWKTYGLTKATLEMGMKLINPTKAKALEDKWKMLLDDETEFQMDWATTRGEIFAMLFKTHKGMS